MMFNMLCRVKYNNMLLYFIVLLIQTQKTLQVLFSFVLCSLARLKSVSPVTTLLYKSKAVGIRRARDQLLGSIRRI